MTRRRLATLAVVGLLVAAGCVTGTPGTGTTTETTTPGDAPSPPGVENGTVTNASALVAAHEATLVEAGSFTSRWNQTFRGRTTTTTVQYSAADGIRWSSERAKGQKIRWAPGLDQIGYALVKNEGSEAEYGRVTSPDSVGRVTQSRSLEQLVASFEYERVGTDTVDGTSVVVLRSTNVTRPRKVMGLWNLGSMQGATLTLKVDEDGVIRSYEHTIEREGDDIAIDSTFRAVGTTTVEKPAWVEDAREQLRAVGLDVNKTEGVVRLLFQSGASIPEGSMVTLDTPERNGSVSFELDQPLREGTVYYVDVGETPEIASERPESRDLPAGTYYLAVEDPDGKQLFTLYGEVKATTTDAATSN